MNENKIIKWQKTIMDANKTSSNKTSYSEIFPMFNVRKAFTTLVHHPRLGEHGKNDELSVLDVMNVMMIKQSNDNNLSREKFKVQMIMQQ